MKSHVWRSPGIRDEGHGSGLRIAAVAGLSAAGGVIVCTCLVMLGCWLRSKVTSLSRRAHPQYSSDIMAIPLVSSSTYYHVCSNLSTVLFSSCAHAYTHNTQTHTPTPAQTDAAPPEDDNATNLSTLNRYYYFAGIQQICSQYVHAHAE